MPLHLNNRSTWLREATSCHHGVQDVWCRHLMLLPPKKPHAVPWCRQFADLVLYVEACEAGSMFEGLLNDSLNIYVTTAANAHESSWGTYCPGMHPSSPAEFTTCLADLYSVSWMENR